MKNTPEKYSWLLLAVVGFIIIFFGLSYFLTGVELDSQVFTNTTGLTWAQFTAGGNPLVLYVMDILRVLGLGFVGVGVYIVAITRTAFRGGERWAWYSLWFAPLVTIYVALTTYQRGGSLWPVAALLAVLSLLGLLWPLRQFFPKR